MFKKIWVLFFALLLAACSHDGKVLIKGVISGGEGKMIYLDHVSVNGTLTIDSVKLGGNGRFRFLIPKEEYTAFYYLRNHKGYGVTLLVDTITDLIVNTHYLKMEERATFEGAPATQRLWEYKQSINKERNRFSDFKEAYDASASPAVKLEMLNNYSAHLRAYKDSLGIQLMKEPGSMISYYILFQKLNDNYLMFDINTKEDYTYFAAVATSLNTYYPKDPRVVAFYQKTLQALRLQKQDALAKRISEAETGIPEIALPDIKGDTLRLTSIQNKVVVLNFWSSQSTECRLWNKSLKRMYDKYANSGLEIFQVSIDKSKVMWENAMQVDQITWKSVCDYSSGQSKAALWYNVTKVPTTFILNRSGDIMGRVNTEVELEKEIKKNL